MSKPQPWYRSGWVWFIVGLLSVTVVASLATVSVAFGLGDLSVATVEAGPRPVSGPDR